MAVSKAAIGATAGTGTAAAAATTALTVGGGASGEKISDSFDSVSEPSVNDESDAVYEDDTSLPKTKKEALSEKVDLVDAPGQLVDKVANDHDDVDVLNKDQVSLEHTPLADEVKGPKVPEKSADDLVKDEINNKVLDKRWNLTSNDVFISDLYSNYCLQRLFVDELPEEETTDLGSSDNHKVFEGNNRKAFGCLGTNYSRMNKKESTHWKGISYWGWGIRKGDEGFMYLGAFKNEDDNGKKIKYFSKTFHMKKEDGSWVNKYYKAVDGKVIDISGSSKKIPKGGSVLPNSSEDYVWGLYSDETINNACGFRSSVGDNNCGFYFSKSGDLEETDSTKYWFWEEGAGNTKFKSMQSNFDDWWADAFGNNSINLQGVHEKEGAWIEWN